MLPAHLVLVALGREALQRVRADGVEHGNAAVVPRSRYLLQQALVEERVEPIHHVDRGHAIARSYRRRRLQRAAPHKDGQAGKEVLLARVEQVVAPVDGPTDGVLARRVVTCATREQIEAAT